MFGQDTFAFTNELVWSYEFSTNGTLRTRKIEPPPRSPHRCFPMARSAREFFYHARFAPELPKVDEAAYARLVRQVVGRNSRCRSEAKERIIIPGYTNLFSFSAEHEPILRKFCGGAAASYLQRGNWRMVFPISSKREGHIAQRLVNEIYEGELPIVHIYRFPDVRLNHALLLFEVESDQTGWIFNAYDPNDPGHAATLKFEHESGAFFLERNRYFAGGSVRVYEVYRGWFY
jgi:hypothetical protein